MNNNIIKEDIISGVKLCIQKEFDIPAEELTPDARIQVDLGLDSLDRVELAMRIEQHFNILFPDEEIWTKEAINASITEIADAVIVKKSLIDVSTD